jgi:hypothetical protein
MMVNFELIEKGVRQLAVKVELSAIIDGIEFQDDQVTSYLNLKTGQVITLHDAAFFVAEDDDDENIDFEAEGELWLRPLEMFAEQIIVKGQKIRRFEYIGDK